LARHFAARTVPVECRRIHASSVARFSSDAKEVRNSSTLTVAGIPFLATCFWLLGRSTARAASALVSTAALRAVALVPHVLAARPAPRDLVLAGVPVAESTRRTACAARRSRHLSVHDAAGRGERVEATTTPATRTPRCGQISPART
jgi:hypothetical protein